MKKLLPGSLFGRLLSLLTILIFMVFGILALLFQYDRENLLLLQFGYTKAIQLQILRSSLESGFRAERPDILKRFGEQHDAQIYGERRRIFNETPLFVPLNPGDPLASSDLNPENLPTPSILFRPWRPFPESDDSAANAEHELFGNFINLENYLKKMLGADTKIRVQRDHARSRSLLWIRFSAAGSNYWAGFPLPDSPQIQDLSSRAFFLALIVIGVLVLFAFAFARYLTQPLSKLARSVNMVGRGEYPPPLPTSGPSEFAALNRGFNAMTTRLKKVDEERAMLLAGVSHDLRTPLARLRLSVEINTTNNDERDLMIEDIDAIDRIIDQFLEFSRSDSDAKMLLQNANPLIASCVGRYQRSNIDVRFRPDQDLPPILLRTVAFERLIFNLINNALNHGRPPVEITTGHDNKIIWINVVDHGDGFPKTKEERERLKEPFRRASDARSTPEGKLGAGLGLAIVDRIVRLHHGKFDLLEAPDGGALVRIMLPRPPE